MVLISSDILAIVAAALLFVVLKAFNRERENVSKRGGAAPPGSTEEEKVAEDKGGPYRFPLVTSLPEYDLQALKETKPIPYRPFKWGPVYPQHMGIRNLSTVDAWLQIDNLYPSYLALRQSRTTQLGPKVTRTLPGYHSHSLEALCEIASFLSVRFPCLFEVTRVKYDPADERTFGDSIVGEEAGSVAAVKNLVTGETFDVGEIEEKEGSEWNPMQVAGLLLQDDLALMVQDPPSGGQYRFVAGSICTAGSWRLRDKLGLTLDEIHFTGQVPQYGEKYQKSMNRFFANLSEDKIVERNNYFFQTDSDLAWSTASNGPEEIYDDLEKGPNPDLLKRTEGASEPVQATETYLNPVRALVQEPAVPGRMASALRSWPRDVHWYKGAGKYTPVLLPYLDRLHEEQVLKGAVELDEKGKTRESYPF
ncbi:hypothetical protein JCM1840_007572 [Sporobolomyces johnsonii]